MVYLFCLLFVMTSALAQQLEGPRTIFSDSTYMDPKFNLDENGSVRLFWSDGESRLSTALYDWEGDAFIEPPITILTTTTGFPRAQCVEFIDGHWEAIIEEVDHSWWELTIRVLYLRILDTGVSIDTLFESFFPPEPGEPYVQFLPQSLRERPGGGRILLLSRQEIQCGDDYRIVMADYPGALFLNNQLLSDGEVFSEISYISDQNGPCGIVVEQDSVVFVRSPDFDDTYLIALSRSGASMHDTLDCPQLWAAGLALNNEMELVLFSTPDIHLIHPGEGCETIGDANAPDWASNDVLNSWGGAFVSGPTGVNYVRLTRINIDGTIPVAAGLVFLSEVETEYCIHQDVEIHDSLVYVLWTAGEHWQPSEIGMFRIGWSDEISDVDIEPISIPSSLSLSAYPNPFNSEVTINYELERAAEINLTVYNSLGQVVETLFTGEVNAGSHEQVWQPVSGSGVYFIRLSDLSTQKIQKVLYLK
jgi:hypothetical protein